MTVPAYDWVAHYASRRGRCIAIDDLATGRRFTYTDFDERVGRLGTGLRERFGTRRGDRIAILAHNSSDLFELQFACTRIGAIFTPMNWRLTASELRFIIGDCQPMALFYDPEFAATAAELSAACGIKHLCDREPANGGYEQLIADATVKTNAVPLDHDDIATILYTSGTTGHPKGAMITHGMRFWQSVNLTGPARLTADSTCLVALPQFHVGGLDVLPNPTFHQGGRVVVMRTYDPASTLRLFCDPGAGITHFLGAPAHFQSMAQLPQFADAVFHRDLLAFVGAAPVPLSLLQQWRAQGLTLIQGYGMTETCGAIMLMEPDEAVRKAGSAGKPCLHFEVRLVRADGTDSAANEIGEIWVKGPNTTPGYWRQPATTANAFTDGWLRTGDAAVADEDGFYYILDRWKDMYISGGENVYPAEIEDVLYQLPAIAEVAVIGVPDERWGEIGRAIIALKPGSVLTEVEIHRHCEAKLARYKHPRSVCFVEALPRNATGKVHKPTLRQRFGTV